MYGYKNKPSLKEFIQKELKTTKEIKEKVHEVKENVQEVKARTIENKQDENINKQFTLNEIDLDGIVKVPLKTLLELVRNIGYLDRVKEEESK